MLHPVVLFISDDRSDRWCLEPISKVTEWIASGEVRPVARPGGATWWAVPASLIFDDC